MTRTLRNQMIEKGLVEKYPKKEQSKQPIKKLRQKGKNKKQNEKLSQRDIEDLMGINRPTYRRNRGAFRQS